MSVSKKKSYRELKAELESILQWFEGGNIDVDEALTKHKEARSLLDELEAYLAETEQKITKVTK
jgi:exodeoxyribonuclease VII small subunit